MSKIALSGSPTGTGVFTIESPSSNTSRTLTLPDEAGTVLTTAGVPASAMPAGSVLQVVHVESSSDVFASLGVEATVLSLNITPQKSTSKFLILSSLTLKVVDTRGTAYTDGGVALIIRDNTTEVTRSTVQTLGSYDIEARDVVSMVIIDSPNTLSSINYKLTIKGQEPLYDTAEAKGSETKNSLVVMEISA
jgi:hypothetical protein